MRYATIFLAIAGLAAAQSSTTSAEAAASTSGCGAQVDTVIASCLGTENAQLNACDSNDWDCLCTQSINVSTCYNNCPGDPASFGAKQQETSYCNAAKVYGTKTASTTTSSASSAMSSSTGSASTTGSASQTESSSGSATKTNAASEVGPAIGLLGALFGVAALL